MTEWLSRLPKVPADRLAKPFKRFLHIVAGAVLLMSTLMALALANSPWSASFFALWDAHIGVLLGSAEIFRSLTHWISDGLMTLFFFVIALELKRELVLGELRDPRVAALTGIGFMMALFIADLAFGPELLSSVKLGILGVSIVSAARGLLLLTWLTSAERDADRGSDT